MITFHTFAQDFELLEAAFKKSYEYEKKGEYQNAINELKNVYREDSYENNLRLGWLVYLSGSFTESSAYYQKAINLKPYSIEAKLGYVLPVSSMGNWTAVKAEYFKILEIDPMNSLVNYRLGLIFYNAKDYKTALKYFETVVNQYPFDYDSVIMFAWTNYHLGKTREAIILFQKALLIKPGDDSANEGLDLVK
jgi:tetratricopeptide (TPR) repeat protein